MSLAAMGQQKPQYNQYVINNYLLNPAIAGIEEYVDVRIGARQQFTGVDGAPSTQYVSAHMPLGYTSYGHNDRNVQQAPSFSSLRNNPMIKPKPHHGIGLMVVHDEIGAFSRTEASFAYAYHLLLSKEIKLAAGASAGIIQESVSASKLEFFDPADPTDVDWNAVKPNLNMGLWLYSSNFYVGVSGAQLFANDVHFDDTIDDRNHQSRHYFVTGAYKFELTDRLSLIPSVMAMWVQPLPGSIDFNLRGVYDNRFWVGGSYRENGSFAALAGVNLSSTFDVGYSYDTGMSGQNGVNSGSHEVVVGIRLLNKRKVFCPSNLW